MLEGRVTRAVGGFFDVAGEMGEVRRCRARGVFRKRGVTVLVGDLVCYEPVGTQEGIIREVLPRRTELVRPPVANVDHALLVFSAAAPPFHPQLLDRALVAAAAAGLTATLAVSKCDLADPQTLSAAVAPYEAAGYRVIRLCTPQGIGVDEVRAVLAGRVTVFVGPSGAGKSSLGNALHPSLGLKMGDISEKLGRGRHTTRHVELFHLGEGTYVVDAPGFSQLELDVSSRDLRLYFPEFAEWAEACAYRGCEHDEEEGCAVRAAAASGRLAASRYANYQALLHELRAQESRRY
ncbi:MAG: ribosome small subunit-dependent GTPase A [Alicyclobacillus sp.]|nr:ribosome small subunit-dependent GTPase A [Alicyclobacillus sp.]